MAEVVPEESDELAVEAARERPRVYDEEEDVGAVHVEEVVVAVPALLGKISPKVLE